MATTAEVAEAQVDIAPAMPLSAQALLIPLLWVLVVQPPAVLHQETAAAPQHLAQWWNLQVAVVVAVQEQATEKACPAVLVAVPAHKALHFPLPMLVDQAMRLPPVLCRAMQVAQLPTTVPAKAMLQAVAEVPLL